MNRRGEAIEVLIGTIVVGGLVSLVAVGCWAWPKYNVYESRMSGEAQLAEAQSSKTVKVTEAKAKSEAAEFERASDSIRALGVAAANRIIGHSLRDNPEYLTWLKIEALRDTKGQTIYVPTEAQLPITEAGRGVR